MEVRQKFERVLFENVFSKSSTGLSIHSGFCKIFFFGGGDCGNLNLANYLLLMYTFCLEKVSYELLSIAKKLHFL